MVPLLLIRLYLSHVLLKQLISYWDYGYIAFVIYQLLHSRQERVVLQLACQSLILALIGLTAYTVLGKANSSDEFFHTIAVIDEHICPHLRAYLHHSSVMECVTP